MEQLPSSPAFIQRQKSLGAASVPDAQLSPPAPLAEHTRSPDAFRSVKGKQYPYSQFWIQSQSLHFLELTKLFAAPWLRMFLEAVLKGDGLLLERIFQE